MRHCSILEFGRGDIQSSSRPRHHQTSARHWQGAIFLCAMVHFNISVAIVNNYFMFFQILVPVKHGYARSSVTSQIKNLRSMRESEVWAE